ncbi:hypothetical protein U879_03490 [Defluviimonas sp. 20V17]|uniref:Uncharacterized protein n=1 Tax=Allgaiera indica TaxID=765699 RepID=A0AAN4UTZ2_9RHOB|nr:hypothetical protein [Allgaiera indica]KDB05071.1 hypothetical protein U879_03490 [Defluviimonas sp. 20V17]GHE04522.1 hypothetical protein GCM10008024_31990 [Allgaiera indica]SDX57203.1 hypothetical protein SAMN05444006_12035 [Allgaiera indica]
MAEFWIRLLILLSVGTGLAVTLRLADRRFQQAQKLVFRFTIFSYSLTYFLGICMIFLLENTAFSLYFSKVVFFTRGSVNFRIFFLSLIPFVCLLAVAWLPRIRLRRAGTPKARRQWSSFAVTFLTAGMTLFTCAGFVGGDFPMLLGNTLSFGNISGIGALYQLRFQATSQLHTIEAGIMYGTLPALMTGLLLYEGRYVPIMRVFAAVTGLAVVIMNLGLFQVAPLMTIVLLYVMTRALISDWSVFNWRNVAIGSAFLTVYSAYSLIKSSGGGISFFSTLFDIMMRMPVAGPYLVQMKLENPGTVNSATYLPQALGYYMFPEIAASNSHISMPQPSFMVSWFYDGTMMSAVLMFLALLLPFWFARFLMSSISARNVGQPTFPQTTLVYSLFHYIYYLFQTSHFETFVSSYSVIFPLMPAAVYLALSLLLKPRKAFRGRPRSLLQGTLIHETTAHQVR